MNQTSPRRQGLWSLDTNFHAQGYEDRQFQSNFRTSPEFRGISQGPIAWKEESITPIGLGSMVPHSRLVEIHHRPTRRRPHPLRLVEGRK